MIEWTKSKVGPIAQSVEQRTFNPWVDGSSPSGPTILQAHYLILYASKVLHQMSSPISEGYL